MSVCKFNCSEDRTLAAIPDYSDISGIGVIVGYTATAGVAVVIITGYYFIAHHPELDPFRSEEDHTQAHAPYTPHPVDKIILDRARRFGRKLGKRSADASTTGRTDLKKDDHFEKALLKCVLTISDLQILTGLSILISGYTQLRCGLSVYHWQILVYLTWFCSLTHLSCLTFLRTYLHNHPGERVWRLIGMGALVVMLIVALLPTGNYGTIDPAEYAICSFKHLRPLPGTDLGDTYSYSYNDPMLNFMSMIISVLLLGLGFLSRIVRLHRSLAVGIISRPRKYLSDFVRNRLRKYHDKCLQTTEPVDHPSRARTLIYIYRPALAVFLACRFILDLWSSLALEVWWLNASFAWGVYNLVTSLNMKGSSKSPPQNVTWTFGQIAPVILLLAPMLSVIELLYEPSSTGKTPAEVDVPVVEPQPPPRTETMELATTSKSSLPDGVPDHPDHNFYGEAWSQSLVILLLCGVIGVTIAVLFVPIDVAIRSPGSSKGAHLQYLIPTADIFSWLPVSIVSFTVCMTMCSFLLESMKWKARAVRYGMSSLMLTFGFIFPMFVPFGSMSGFLFLGLVYMIYSRRALRKRSATS